VTKGYVLPDYTIKSLDRGLLVLVELAKEAAPIGVTELARRLGVHKNVSFRTLATLKDRGFVRQDEEERYELDAGVLEIASAYLGANQLKYVTAVEPLSNGKDPKGWLSGVALVPDDDVSGGRIALVERLRKAAE
jgi:ribonucleotide reductase alpha subunit